VNVTNTKKTFHEQTNGTEVQTTEN